ncbi:MAG: hypothetical protein Kow0077_32860 [Anaerolineae bacterium]
MTQTLAQQALEEALSAHQAARKRIYEQQLEAYRDQAAQAYREVIRPWWQEFVRSEQGAKMSLLVDNSDLNKDPVLWRPRISERVTYIREDGREWEAYVYLDGAPRALELWVRQLREGLEPTGWAHAMFLNQQLRRIPLEEPELPALDLHPIVLIDFAEQIELQIVNTHIQMHLKNKKI